jgi:hypothetical protein
MIDRIVHNDVYRQQNGRPPGVTGGLPVVLFVIVTTRFGQMETAFRKLFKQRFW